MTNAGDSGTLIAVTGASGFLGRHVCDHLSAAGRRVRRIVRRTGGTADGVVAVSDITDGAALRSALDDADVIVHLVGRSHVRRDDRLDEYRRVNVEGTRAVLDAALHGRATRVVYVSSVKAIGESSLRDGSPLTDVSPAQPTTPYGITKLEAE